jgi:hypothetical protein
MKKIIPYLIFLNCKNTNDEKTDKNKNPIVNNETPNINQDPPFVTDKNNLPIKDFDKNKEIIDKMEKIYEKLKSDHLHKFSQEEQAEIENLKFEYQKNNQKIIIEEIFYNLKGVTDKQKKAIKKYEKPIIVFIDTESPIKESKENNMIFFKGINKNFIKKIIDNNNSKEVILIVENSGFTTIVKVETEDLKKLDETDDNYPEYIEKVKALNKEGEFVNFLEKDFDSEEIKQGYYRINFSKPLLKYVKIVNNYLEKNKDKKFIIFNSDSGNMDDFRNSYKDFLDNVGELENCFLHNSFLNDIYRYPIDYDELKKNKSPILYKINLSDYKEIQYLFYSIFLKKLNLLYFEGEYKIQNKKIEKGKIFTVEDFFKNIKEKNQKIKLNFHQNEKDDIEESLIYQNYKDLFEITYK